MRTMNDVLQHSPNERQPMDLPEAEDAILARWEDPDAQVSDDSEQEATPDIDEDETTDVEEYEEEEEDQDLDEDEDDPELEDEEPEDDDDDDEETAERIDDEAEVEVTVDGEVHRASVKDLKRLYGQEASLNRKSKLLPNSVNS